MTTSDSKADPMFVQCAVEKIDEIRDEFSLISSSVRTAKQVTAYCCIKKIDHEGDHQTSKGLTWPRAPYEDPDFVIKLSPELDDIETGIALGQDWLAAMTQAGRTEIGSKNSMPLTVELVQTLVGALLVARRQLDSSYQTNADLSDMVRDADIKRKSAEKELEDVKVTYRVTAPVSSTGTAAAAAAGFSKGMKGGPLRTAPLPCQRTEQRAIFRCFCSQHEQAR